MLLIFPAIFSTNIKCMEFYTTHYIPFPPGTPVLPQRKGNMILSGKTYPTIHFMVMAASYCLLSIIELNGCK